MTVLSLLVFMVIPLLAAATPPLISAGRAQGLYLTDFGLLLIPTAAFVLTLLTLNKSAQTGFAVFVYPLVVLATSVVGLYIRSYLFPASRAASAFMLVTLVVFAGLFGAVASPLYE